MTLRNSHICIDRLHVHAFHGVMEQERRVGGDFLVSLRISYDVSRAMDSDDVNDTLNYAEVCRLVRQEMSQPSKLLEHAAARMARTLFDHFPQATAIDLRLTKLNPPMGADCDGASVEIYVTND